MNPLILIAVPVLFTLVLLVPGMRKLPTLLLLAAAAIDAITSIVIGATPQHTIRLGVPYILLDPTARLFIVLINVIFLGIAAYVWNRVRLTPLLADGIDHFARFALLFMAAANFAIISNHLLGMWIALEATTLTAAPLIVRVGTPSTRRASWTYFLFSSVGLGIALLGLMCLSHSLEVEGHEPSLFLDSLSLLVTGPPNAWRNVGLALVLLGYGTKLGLAPMYSWLPDTYDEAPPAVTAMLASVQFNCALVAVLRVIQVYRPGSASLISTELVGIGVASMAVSTFGIIATRNLKRLIAYASINHAGVIAIGLGVGKTASYGLLLYVVSNAFIKTILFLTTGQIKAHYGTKDTRLIAGLITDLPYSGTFLMVGTFALLGFPPFGSFLGELIILSGLFRSGYITVFVIFCCLITLTFVATGRTVFPMIWGEPKRPMIGPRQTLGASFPKLVFLVALVALGIYMPPMVNTLFRQVAHSLGGP